MIAAAAAAGPGGCPGRWWRAARPPGITAALDAYPQARAFFDSLAQFHRTAYLRWIDATKRRPEQRAQRIAEVVRLLEAGHRQRPRPER
jgi:uncharacterized protein YdeI (YjbR/CyaY-like superfamily)